MDVQRWSKVQALYLEAVDLPLDERDAFLLQACGGDSTLRAEVEALLRSDSATRGTVAHERPREAENTALSSGTLLGAWRIEQLVGRGGMGEVYEASRADGAFELRAAVKLLKRGLDTDAVVRRFLRERRILARLAHPNIAHLLDAGVAPDGRPFLVMEFVEGLPITAHAGGRAVAELLRLMLTVCEAVQSAHAQHVVHRDLKPSNILVSHQGQVKLLDFGIAKLMTEEDPDATRLGPHDQPMTPAYAAPEQFLGLPATPAIDVYALGVILYELLTGRLPHRTDRSLDTATDTAVRPSTVLRHERGRVVEAERQQRLREISGDLDLITLKAIHPEAARRYPSAQEFGDDLRRLLEQRPVRARPDSLAYRVGRFARRNRRTLLQIAAAASVFALASVVALQVQARHNRLAQLYRAGTDELAQHHEARAAVYLSELLRQGMDTPQIRTLLGLALQSVDAASAQPEGGTFSYALAFSPDDRTFASLDQRRLQLWDASNGSAIGSWPNASRSARIATGNVSFSPDGLRIGYLNLPYDKPCDQHVLDVRSGTELAAYDCVNSRLGATQMFSADGRRYLAIDASGHAQLHDLAGGTHGTLPGESLVTAGFGGDGRFLYTADASGAIVLYDGMELRRLRDFHLPTGGLTAFELSADGQLLAAGGQDGAVRVWETASGALRLPAGLPDRIESFAFSRDGTRLLVSSTSKAAVWDTETGSLLYAQSQSSGFSVTAVLTTDGQLLRAAEHGVEIVDLRSARTLYSLDGNANSVEDAVAGHRERVAVTSGPQGDFVSWKLPRIPLAELPQGKPVFGKTEAALYPPSVPARFNASGERIVTGGNDGVVRLWSRDGEPLGELRGHESPLTVATFSPDGRRLLSADRAGRMLLWDVASGHSTQSWAATDAYPDAGAQLTDDGHVAAVFNKQTHQLRIYAPGRIDPIADLATDGQSSFDFSPDGRRLAYTAAGTARLIEVEGKPLWSARPDPAAKTAAAVRYSPDGRRIAMCFENGAALLDATDGRVLATMRTPLGRSATARFDLDGQRIAIADSRSNITWVWTPATGAVLRLEGQDSGKKAAAFSPDGSLVATGDALGRVQLWNAQNGVFLATIGEYGAGIGVDDLRFNADGTRVLAGSLNNLARLWAVPRATGSPDGIARDLRCRAPWRLQGTALLPQMPDPSACAPRAAE